MALLLEAIALHQGNDAERVELLSRLCVAYIYCDRSAEAKEAHRRAVALARRIDDMRSLYLALSAIACGRLLARVAGRTHRGGGRGLGDRGRTGDARTHPSEFAGVLPGATWSGSATSPRWAACATRACGCRRSGASTTGCRCAGTSRRGGHQRRALSRTPKRGRTRRWKRAGGLPKIKAVGGFGMQMFCLRREQGRLREALPMLQHFVRETPTAQTWLPGLALLYAELGMRDECQAVVRQPALERACRARPPTPAR